MRRDKPRLPISVSYSGKISRGCRSQDVHLLVAQPLTKIAIIEKSFEGYVICTIKFGLKMTIFAVCTDTHLAPIQFYP